MFFLGFKSSSLCCLAADDYIDNELVSNMYVQCGVLLSYQYCNCVQTRDSSLCLCWPGFCRDAVFSITSAYNSGALHCQCDFDGSLSFECKQFGGQCPCKPNVIGRKCDACKSGYFGFPNCQPCNCPSRCTDTG